MSDHANSHANNASEHDGLRDQIALAFKVRSIFAEGVSDQVKRESAEADHGPQIDAVMAVVRPELDKLRKELADKHAELRTEIELNYPALREYALMNADLQDQGFEPGEAGLRTALGRLLRIREAVDTSTPRDGAKTLADRIGYILGPPNTWACQRCYGFRAVPDWSNWTPADGDPDYIPCPACSGDQPTECS